MLSFLTYSLASLMSFSHSLWMILSSGVNFIKPKKNKKFKKGFQRIIIAFLYCLFGLFCNNINTTYWLCKIAQSSVLKEMYKGLSESPATNTEYLLKHHYELWGANNAALPLYTNNSNNTSQQERSGWKHTRLQNNSKRLPGNLSKSRRITEICLLSKIPTTIKRMNFITTFHQVFNVTFCSLQQFLTKNIFEYDTLHATLFSLTCCTLCSFSCVNFKITITTLGALGL